MGHKGSKEGDSLKRASKGSKRGTADSADEVSAPQSMTPALMLSQERRARRRLINPGSPVYDIQRHIQLNLTDVEFEVRSWVVTFAIVA